MNKIKKEGLFNDSELSVVPAQKRKGLFTITAVLLCWVINPTPASTGGSIANGMTLPLALLAIFIGAIILGIYSMPVAIVGAKEGLSTSMVSKIAFGEKGSNIVAIAMAIANVIFYGVTVGFFVISLEAVLGMASGSLTVWGGIIACVIMGSSALLGFKGVSRLSNIAVIPMCLVVLIAAGKGVVDGGGWVAINQIGATGNQLSFGAAITTAIGIFIAGATLAGDVTRFSDSNKKAAIASLLSFGIGFFIFVSLGAIAVKGTGSSDLVTLICTMGGTVFTIVGFLLLLISTWSSADNNVYSAGLALSKLFKMPKYIFTIITIVVGAIVCATGAYANLAAYCGLLAMLMPPIGIIIAIDYFVFKKGVEDKTSDISDFHWAAIIAWAIAVVVDFFTGNPLGVLPYASIGVSGINSLVVGAIAFFVLEKVMSKQKSAPKVAG